MSPTVPATFEAMPPADFAMPPIDDPMLETALIGAVKGVIIFPKKLFFSGAGAGGLGGGEAGVGVDFGGVGAGGGGVGGGGGPEGCAG